ncbi:acetyl-CoA synthetase [Helicostylum pulchrum]|uniref:Acetyl-CoA synthetase n=1 Tax=Helicostylum pulchrum TaxID=562976 RepID=A0ABP9Y133_9FUNG
MVALSTAEIESALILHSDVAEAAVIAGYDELTGQCIHAFCTLKPLVVGVVEPEQQLIKNLILQVRKTIGPFAKPKAIYIVQDLPKTRSGKILRRVLRKIVNNESDQIGDTSTMADEGIIHHLINAVKGTTH